MKELTREIKTTEVYGYKAEDGTYFNTKEECKKYEESAKLVCYGKAKQYLIGESTEYGITEFGCDDIHVDIYTVPDMEAAKIIEQYIVLETGSKDDVGTVTSRIGKEIILFWNYDKDYVWVTTLEEYLEVIKNNYARALKKED